MCSDYNNRLNSAHSIKFTDADENVENNTTESSLNQCGYSRGKRIGCSLCPIRFTHLSSAKRHIKQFHGGDGAVVSLSEYFNLFNLKFSWSLIIGIFLGNIENDESKPVESMLSNSVEPSEDSPKSYENRPFGCKLCPLRFTRRGNVNRHIRQCHRSEGNDLLLKSIAIIT